MSTSTGEEFSPRATVGAALDLLAQRLEPIIATRLGPVVKDLPWTAILIALDDTKGRPRRKYARTDLQAQLRVLTERLGSVGFPFDTKGDHATSIHAGELRLYRNAWAHMNELDAADAFRVCDTSRRLLTALGDEAGVEEFERKARAAALNLVPQSVGPRSVPVAPDVPIDAGHEIVPPAWYEEAGAVADMNVQPPAEVLAPDSAEESNRSAGQLAIPAVAAHRPEYVPWRVTNLGGSDVLDDLPKRYAKQRIWAAAGEISDYEAPISLHRLVTLVARAYGCQRIGGSKRRQIERQIGNVHDLTVDADGFVWTAGIDPARWTGFRSNPGSTARRIVDISPIEIANALRIIRRRSPQLTHVELERRVLATFGKQRRTKNAQEQLARAWAIADTGNATSA